MYKSFFLLGIFIWSGAVAAENIAPMASPSASSTACFGSHLSPHCYDASRANHGDTSKKLSGLSSWSNNRAPFPQFWQAIWPSFVRLDRATIYTSEGYPIQDFDLQYYDAYLSRWETLKSIKGNTDLVVNIDFSAVYTDRLRVVGHKGPARQTIHVRLNEVVVEGNADYL